MLPFLFIVLIVQESNISILKLHIPGFFMKYVSTPLLKLINNLSRQNKENHNREGGLDTQS